MSASRLDELIDALPDAPGQEPPTNPLDAAIDLVSAQVESENGRLAVLFDRGIKTPADRHAGILSLAQETGLPADYVEQNYDTWKPRVEASNFDPVTFRRDYPDLADAMLAQPDKAPLIIQKGPRLWQAIKSYFRAATGGGLFTEEEFKRFVETGDPRQERVVADRSELGTLRGVVEAAKQGQAQTEYANLAFKDWAGTATWEEQKLAADLRRRLVPAYYGQGTLGQFAIDAANQIPLQVGMLAEGGVVAGGAGLVAGGATLAATKGDKEAAVKVGRKVGGLAGKAAVIAYLYRQETGSTFHELRGTRLDDGTVIDDDVARVAAGTYGAAAAFLEFWSEKQFAKVFGPLGEAITKGQGKQFLTRALQNRTTRQAFKAAAASWLKAGGAEAATETVQRLAQDAVTWLAKGYEGQVTVPDPAGAAVDAFVEDGLPALRARLATGLAPAAINVMSQAAAVSRGNKNAETVAQLVGVAQDPAAGPISDVIAALIKRAAENEDGAPVTDAYLDAAALKQFFQGAAASDEDRSAAVDTLLGPDGTQRLDEAAAGGGKIAVPIAEYLSRFAGTAIGEALKLDTAFRQGEMTAREAAELEKTVMERAQQVAAELEASGEETDAEKQFVGDVVDQLVNTGKYTREEAQRVATLNRALIRTQVDVFNEGAGQIGKIEALRREGVPDALAKQLISKKKTAFDAVNEILGTWKDGNQIGARNLSVVENDNGTRTANWSGAADRFESGGNIGTMSHADAIDLAIESGVERINAILSAPDKRITADDLFGKYRLAVTADAQIVLQGGALNQDPAVVRFAVGKRLSKEDKATVLASLVDVYKAKRAPKEVKGISRSGDEIIGYAHSPDLFEKSDITGRSLRHYVVLPDGRKAHPSELFPSLKEAEVNKYITERQLEEQAIERNARRVVADTTKWRDQRVAPNEAAAVEMVRDRNRAMADLSPAEMRAQYDAMFESWTNSAGEVLPVRRSYTDRTVLEGEREGARRLGFSPPARTDTLYAGDQSAPRGAMQRRKHSAAFLDWFGGSYVRDGAGAPLMVFHGRKGSFGSFDTGRGRGKDGKLGAVFFTSSTKDAQEFSYLARGNEKPNVLPVYLSIQNPFVVDLEGTLFSPDEMADIISRAKSAGHDGVIVENIQNFEDSEPSTSYVVFDSRQVKSVSNDAPTASQNIYEQSSRLAPTSSPLFAGPPSDPRGAMQRLGDMFAIGLFKTADFSTFLHETGHVYLELLADLAEREDAPERIRADWQSTLDWLGVKDRTEIGREQHEQWARGFEQYLREGKAPSITLLAAFERFWTWLRRIYRTADALDIELSDDIRGVFDRLLATDQEIETMRFARDMDETQANALKARARLAVFKTQNAEAQKQLREARERIRGEVDAELSQRPEWAARRALAEAGPTEKLRADNARLMSDGSLRGLAGLTSPEGVHPDDVAEKYGYATGTELVRALATSGGYNAAVNAEVAARLEDRFPELVGRAEDLRQIVHDVAHEADALKVMEDDLKRVSDKAPGANPIRFPKELAQAVARLLFGRVTAGEASSESYLRAEVMAGERYAVALARKDYDAARRFKFQQMVNFYLYKEAREFDRDRTRMDRTLKALKEPESRARIAKGIPAALAVLDQLRSALTGDPLPTNSPAGTLDELLAEYERVGAGPDFDVDAIRALLANPRRPRDLNVAEFRNVARALRNIGYIARRQNDVLLAGQRVQREAVVADIGAALAKRKDRGAEAADRVLVSRRRALGDRLSIARAALLDPRVILYRLGERGKQIWEAYLDGRNRGDAVAERLGELFAKQWDALPGDMQDRRYDLIPNAEADLPIPPETGIDNGPRSRQWMWSLFLNFGNASNRQRVLDGFGWTEQQVLDFFGRNMTLEEATFLQGVLDTINTELWPLVRDTETALNGLAPPKIEATPIVLPFGTFAGGYFPARRDARTPSKRGGAQQVGDITLNDRSGIRFSIDKSFTKRRTATAQYVVDLNWGTVPKHAAQVIHYAAYAQFHRDLAGLLADANLRTTIVRRLGVGHLDALDAWRDAIADPSGGPVGKIDRVLAEILSAGRSRVVNSGIGYSLTVAAGDIANPLVAIVAKNGVSARSGGWNMVRFFGRGISMIREARDLSPEYRRRTNRAAQQLSKELGRIGARGRMNTAQRGLEFVREHAYIFMEFTERVTSAIVWHAAYDDAQRQGKTGRAAVRHADDVVQRVFPSRERAEMPAILRDKGAVGAALVFYSYFNKVGNLIAEDRLQTADLMDDTDAGLARRVGARTLVVARSTAVLFVAMALGDLFSGRGPDEDEGWGEWMVRKTAAGRFALVPFIGGMAEQGIGRATSYFFRGESKAPRMSVRNAPYLDAMQRIGTLAATALDGDKAADARLQAALEEVLFLANVPGAAQGRRTVRGAAAVAEGQAGPDALVYGPPGRSKNPADVIRDLAGAE